MIQITDSFISENTFAMPVDREGRAVNIFVTLIR